MCFSDSWARLRISPSAGSGWQIWQPHSTTLSLSTAALASFTYYKICRVTCCAKWTLPDCCVGGQHWCLLWSQLSHCIVHGWFMRPWTRVIPWVLLVDGPILNVHLLSHTTNAANSFQLINIILWDSRQVCKDITKTSGIATNRLWWR